MHWASFRTAEPAVEPITLEAAREHLREEPGAADEKIAGLIVSAREWAEDYTRRALISQTWELQLDGFWSGELELPRPPLLDVKAIRYVDPQGVTQNVDASVYRFDTVSQPGRVWLDVDQSWPTTRTQRRAVVVDFDAGYGTDPANVPRRIVDAMLYQIARLYDSRDPIVTGTIVNDSEADEALLRPYQVAGW